MDTVNSTDHTMTVNSTSTMSIQMRRNSLFGAFSDLIIMMVCKRKKNWTVKRAVT